MKDFDSMKKCLEIASEMNARMQAYIDYLQGEIDRMPNCQWATEADANYLQGKLDFAQRFINTVWERIDPVDY